MRWNIVTVQLARLAVGSHHKSLFVHGNDGSNHPRGMPFIVRGVNADAVALAEFTGACARGRGDNRGQDKQKQGNREPIHVLSCLWVVLRIAPSSIESCLHAPQGGVLRMIVTGPSIAD
jgi:hypothetical protein